MGAIDKFMNAMRINTDMVDDYSYDDYDEDEYVEDLPESKPLFKLEKDHNESKANKSSKVSNFSVNKKKAANNNYGMEIKSIRPTTIEEASLITDQLLDGNSVIINVTNVDVTSARQILDFTSGSVYALKGTLRKVTDSIFVAVPAGVNIDGTFADKIEE